MTNINIDLLMANVSDGLIITKANGEIVNYNLTACIFLDPDMKLLKTGQNIHDNMISFQDIWEDLFKPPYFEDFFMEAHGKSFNIRIVVNDYDENKEIESFCIIITLENRHMYAKDYHDSFMEEQGESGSKQLEEIQKKLNIINHELHNELSSISLINQSLQKDNKDDKNYQGIEDALKQIKSITSNLSNIEQPLYNMGSVTNVVDLAGVADVHVANDNTNEIELEEFISKIIILEQIRNFNINYDLDMSAIDTDKILKINMNPQALRTSLVNILKNAGESITFNSDEEIQNNGKILIKPYIDEVNSVFCIDVLNNGGNIDEDTLAKINAGEQITSSKPTGKGIGIAHVINTLIPYAGSLKFTNLSDNNMKVSLIFSKTIVL